MGGQETFRSKENQKVSNFVHFPDQIQITDVLFDSIMELCQQEATDHVRETRACCAEDGASPTEDSPAQEASPVSQQAPALRSRLEPARPLLGRCERRRCARVGALHLVLIVGAGALPLVLMLL